MSYPMKTCPTCKKTFPRDARGFFHKNGKTRRRDCTECRNEKAKLVPRDKEKLKANSARYRAKVKALLKEARAAKGKAL